MRKNIVALAALMGALGIILGAFGAHALKRVLTEAQLISYETGVRYQIYHSLLLLFISTNNFFGDKIVKTLGILVFLGVFIFSGSIYLLATNDLTPINFKIIGPITPIGGSILIFSWIYLAISAFKK